MNEPITVTVVVHISARPAVLLARFSPSAERWSLSRMYSLKVSHLRALQFHNIFVFHTYQLRKAPFRWIKDVEILAVDEIRTHTRQDKNYIISSRICFIKRCYLSSVPSVISVALVISDSYNSEPSIHSSIQFINFCLINAEINHTKNRWICCRLSHEGQWKWEQCSICTQTDVCQQSSGFKCCET